MYHENNSVCVAYYKYPLKGSYSHIEYMCLNVIPLLVLNSPRHSIYSNTDIGPLLTYSIQRLY